MLNLSIERFALVESVCLLDVCLHASIEFS
jgi:hypothetical protein